MTWNVFVTHSVYTSMFSGVSTMRLQRESVLQNGTFYKKRIVSYQCIDINTDGLKGSRASTWWHERGTSQNS